MARTTIRTEDITASEVTTAKMAVDPTNADNLASGSVPAARLGNVPPNTGLQNDIATLALHSAIADNKAAFNLTNAFIDQYEDDTGIDNETDVDRNNAGEDMSSITTATEAYYININGYADSTGSSGGHVPTFSTTNNARTSFGESTGSSGFSLNSQSGKNSGLFTIESTLVQAGNGAGPHMYGYGVMKNSSTMDSYTGNAYSAYVGALGFNASSSAGHKLKIVYDTDSPNVITAYKDTGSGYGSGDSTLSYKGANFDATAITTLYFFVPCWSDSTNAWKWDASGTREYGTANATGSYTSTTETANATVSKMGIVVLYKNEAGTATLDTDLIVQVSADGGSNYVSAPLTAAGTFSTGILSAKSNDVTISNTGTAPKYKISFANQSEGVKETQVHGIALLY